MMLTMIMLISDDDDDDDDVELLFCTGAERVSNIGRLCEELSERGEHNRALWPLQ